MEKYLNQKNPREIPNKEAPGKTYPEKAPGTIPDTEPGRNNPRNPQEDKMKYF